MPWHLATSPLSARQSRSAPRHTRGHESRTRQPSPYLRGPDPPYGHAYPRLGWANSDLAVALGREQKSQSGERSLGSVRARESLAGQMLLAPRLTRRHRGARDNCVLGHPATPLGLSGSASSYVAAEGSLISLLMF